MANNKTHSPAGTQSQGLLKRSVRLCVMCGAKVINHNPKTQTCQPLCTRARYNNRTMQQQLEYELAHPDIDFDYPMRSDNWNEPIGDE